MSRSRLECGFVPLVDCAPLVVAFELGFADEEGLDLALRRAPSWSALRDWLAFGGLEAAHMLAPVPIALSMGLGGVPTRLDVLQVLSVNGNVIGVSLPLATAMRRAGLPEDFLAAAGVGRTLIAVAEKPIRVGVPFPLSMHAELLYYWLGRLGLEAPRNLSVRIIPPPLMASAMAEGEIDMFCVGEPWGSVAVEAGVAELILPSSAIWRFAPEKVLAVRHEWGEAHPGQVRALMRAIWRSARWLSDPAHRMTVAELLSREAYLNQSPDLLERALRGRLVVAPDGQEQEVPRFIEFFDGAATFPWRSQAVWIATQLAQRSGLDRRDAAAVARSCFRTDLFRANLGELGADLPGASEKVEGALDQPSPVASSRGEMVLGPDSFFDRTRFDPRNG